MSTETVLDQGFGSTLQFWRKQKGFSQLDLAVEAEVSSRHLSFLETGRARPSRSMVLRLAVALDLPLRERNELLLSAGFAPRYEQRPLEHTEFQEARRALQFILDAHEPYPAFVIDRYWQIALWNRTQELLLSEFLSPGGSPADLNVLDLVFEPGPGRDRFQNWDEIARAVLRRFRRQVMRVGPADPLHKKWSDLQELPGVRDLVLSEDPDRPPPILVPMKVRDGDQVFTWYSTLAVFGATGDVTLDELVIESFFPGDEMTRAFVKELSNLN